MGPSPHRWFPSPSSLGQPRHHLWGGCAHPARGRDEVLVLGQAVKVKKMCMKEKTERAKCGAYSRQPVPAAGDESETCQLVPWRGAGDRDSQEGLGCVTLWLPQKFSHLLSPVSQRAAT